MYSHFTVSVERIIIECYFIISRMHSNGMIKRLVYN